jgi:hypothetical protein
MQGLVVGFNLLVKALQPLKNSGGFILPCLHIPLVLPADAIL